MSRWINRPRRTPAGRPWTKLLVHVRSKLALSLAFLLMAAFLSAFLDALTVIAVVISIASGFYAIYHKVVSQHPVEHDVNNDEHIKEAHHKADLEQFRAFLRSLLMHAGVGTALGGVCTLVGEPQNLIIGEQAGWNFAEFVITSYSIHYTKLYDSCSRASR